MRGDKRVCVDRTPAVLDLALASVNLAGGLLGDGEERVGIQVQPADAGEGLVLAAGGARGDEDNGRVTSVPSLLNRRRRLPGVGGPPAGAEGGGGGERGPGARCRPRTGPE